MTTALLPGPYCWSAYDCAARQVLTNKTPAGTYRAPGRYEANFVRERMIDMAARRLGLDPAELRRQNLISAGEMPYRVGTHTDGHPVVFDSGDYPLLLEKGLAASATRRCFAGGGGPWPPPPARDRPRLLRREERHSALGVCAGGIGSDGGALVHVGSASVGQGVDTVLAQVCAESLGVPYDAVTVRHGDTDTVPEGMGAFGSRASMLGGSAVARAAGVLRERVLELAAERLEVSAADLMVRGDRVVARGVPAVGVASRPGDRARRRACGAVRDRASRRRRTSTARHELSLRAPLRRARGGSRYRRRRRPSLRGGV